MAQKTGSRGRWIGVLAALGLLMPAADAEELRRAVIIDYGDGNRGLQWAEDPPPAGSASREPANRPPPAQPRTSGVPVAGGGGGGGSGRSSGATLGGTPAAGGGSTDAAAGEAPSGPGVELIVGGQSKDGVARKAKVPIIE